MSDEREYRPTDSFLAFNSVQRLLAEVGLEVSSPDTLARFADFPQGTRLSPRWPLYWSNRGVKAWLRKKLGEAASNLEDQADLPAHLDADDTPAANAPPRRRRG